MENNKKSRAIHYVCAIVALIIMTLMSSLTVSAASEKKSEITSITLNKKCTDISINITLEKEYAKEHKSETLYIFELSPWQSTSQLNIIEPVASAKASESMKVTLPYINGNANRLYSKFLVAEKAADGSYSIVTSAKYIENLELLSENSEEYPTTESKKGLQAQMLPDLQLLGVRHALVTVAINEYIVGENNDSAASFVYNGQTYYINRAKLDNLDYRVKALTDSGMNVYMNFVLSKPDSNASAVVKSFYSDTASDSAHFYALNTTNETAMKNFQALMDYMASRYTRPDHAYGFVPNFILGFEINSGRSYNSGATSMQSSVYSYHTAFRVAYAAMTSHYSNGRVYISLGNNFNSASAAPGGTVDETIDWSSKDYLDFFASVIRNSGDIEWGLSINPYPSDRTLTEFWLDDYATTSDSTPFITMKNLGVLTEYMHSDSLTFNGEPRSIIIGEFGVNGDPESNDSQSMQAAAFALAYYAAAQNEDIDAFIWHRHVDHIDEGIYCGLWTAQNDNVQFPLAKKTIYTVFAQIDTEKSAEVTSFVKTLVGSGAFSLFMPDNVKYDRFNVRTIFTEAGADSSAYEKGYGKRTLFDLTQGSLCGFFPTDSFKYVELSPYGSENTTMLYARSADIPTEYAGFGTVITEEAALKDAHYITLDLMAEAPEGVAGVNIMLRLQKNGTADSDTVVFEGETLIKPNEMQTISFSVKDFVKKTDGEVDTLKLWIKTPDAASPDGDYGIRLGSIILQTKKRVSVLGVIVKILLVLVLIAVAGYAVLYIRAQNIRKRRRAERERRMREQLRMQAIQQNRGMNPNFQNQGYTAQWSNRQIKNDQNGSNNTMR